MIFQEFFMQNIHTNNPYSTHPYYMNQPRHTFPAMPQPPTMPDNNKHMEIYNTMRRLWFEHIMWTRSVITSMASNNPDLAETTARLLRNPSDFAAVLLPYYGAEKTNKFKDLFTAHLTIAADLLDAHKARDLNKALSARDKWYQNAAEISAALASMNPYWPEDAFQKMMTEHLGLTEEEMLLRLDGDYKADIKQFDLVQQEALKMADMMSEGLIRQFNL